MSETQRPCPACGLPLPGKKEFCNNSCNAKYRRRIVLEGKVAPDRIDICPECKVAEIPRWKGHTASTAKKTCGAKACVKSYKLRSQRATLDAKKEARLGPKAVPVRTVVAKPPWKMVKPFRLEYCNQNGTCIHYGKCSDILMGAWPRERGAECFKENPDRGRA